MPDLTFEVAEIAATPFAASPEMGIAVRIRNAPPGERIRSVALSCQVRIEAQRRRYEAVEEAALRELFGPPGQWERSLGPLLWAHAHVNVPAFHGEAIARLPLPCTYDLTVASARYFHALEGGSAPLLLLFSGTVFFERADGALQAAPLPWSKEARASLPVRVWKETMDAYFPGSAPLLLRRDAFEALRRYREREGLTTWEDALGRLLARGGSPS
jgi:Family of unknown function (DUF6084)